MTQAFFLTKSYTQAKSAQKSLSEYRIKSKIEKTSTKSGGCAYGIRVFGDVNTAVKILEKKGFLPHSARNTKG